MGDRPPRDLPEVYAKEASASIEDPERELKLQAIRIGELGITAIPNEVFALTGLKIKAQSPLPVTMNIELANGSEGYIPPPEQHALGGYTTWPARTAALEVQAEPKIVATVLGLLERVAGRPRRDGPPEQAALRRARPGRPARWPTGGSTRWRDRGPRCHRPRARRSGSRTAIAFFLPGPDLPGLRDGQADQSRRPPRGRPARVGPGSRSRRSPTASSSGSGTACRTTRGPSPATCSRAARGKSGRDTLGLGGSSGRTAGRLFFVPRWPGPDPAGKTEISPKTWHHLVLTRTGGRIAVHLDGNPEPEIAGDVEPTREPGSAALDHRRPGRS